MCGGDLYAERYSPAELDLLDLRRRQRTSERNQEETRRRSTPQSVEIQTPSPLTENVLRVVAEEPRHGELVKENDLFDKLREASRPTKPTAGENRPAFLRLVVGALSENSRRILGENGAQRFEEFKRYQDGWDYGRGKPLSPRSVATLEGFLRQMPDLAALEPSLFLTSNGNVQLGWEDAEGNVVELEYFPDRIEYYIESLNEEGSISLEALHQLIEIVRPTIP